jgi:hypothetical protein
MNDSSIVIDCDSHVMEPPDLWEKYLEHKFRDRAIRIDKDPVDGLEVLMVDNQPLLKGASRDWAAQISRDRNSSSRASSVTWTDARPQVIFRRLG